MQQFALGGEEVLLPLLLQVNQRPTPFAEGEMLETGEREEIVLGVLRHMTAGYLSLPAANSDRVKTSTPFPAARFALMSSIDGRL